VTHGSRSSTDYGSGELLRAMVPNDGSVSADTLESGAAVSVHLPPDALRVLTMDEPEESDQSDGPDEPPEDE
jgi:hypothetical protein